MGTLTDDDGPHDVPLRERFPHVGVACTHGGGGGDDSGGELVRRRRRQQRRTGEVVTAVAENW